MNEHYWYLKKELDEIPLKTGFTIWNLDANGAVAGTVVSYTEPTGFTYTMVDWSGEGVEDPGTSINWMVWGFIVPGSVALAVIIALIVFFVC